MKTKSSCSTPHAGITSYRQRWNGYEKTTYAGIGFQISKSLLWGANTMTPTTPNRKEYPMFRGLLVYFPDALKEVSHISHIGNTQHNDNTPLHWDRSKSQDELDALMRHLTDHARGEILDTDGCRHLAKVCWRALAMLQKELESTPRR